MQQANEMGYKTYLYIVCLDDPLLNISRVLDRADKGGHPVPQIKIIDRYQKALDNLFPAIQIVKKAYLFDNSKENMVMIAKVINGEIILKVKKDKIPNWFVNNVLDKL